MAETMDQSREVPRANVNVDVDIHLWPEGTNAMTRLMQAMIHGIQQVPKLNSWYRHGDKPTLEVRDAVDLGVAVDTPEGLVVVTLRDIAGLSGSEMRIRLKELQEKIKKGEIQSSELTGNTITLSNIGSIGGRYADPIVVPPTVAIVAAGRSGDQVVAYEGKPEVHRVMPLSLSFDHRPIDGAEATRFLEAMKTDLERPQSAVTPRPKGEKGNGSHGRPVPTESVVSKVERMEVEAVDRANRDLAATGEFRMEFPHIGEGVTKGELVTWLVKEGDRVRNDQDIAEVMTDKATVTIPSPVDGVVKSLKFQEGDMIEVGETFIILNTEESPSAQRKNKGNGSPSNGSGNGSGAGHQDFIEPSSRQASPVVAEAAPVEETLLESSVPFAALEPIPQTRAELVSSPRTPLPDVELTPLPGKIHTAPQTADRPKPQLEILQDGEGSRKLQAFSSAEEVIQFLTERSELNAQDKILYTQFVLDRLPPYSELLSSFCLPSGTARLDTALRYFVDYFSDESSHGFRSDLREHHLVSKGREADHPLGQDLLVLMRRSQDDAVYFLDRLGQLEGAQDLRFVGMDAAKDLHRIQPKLNYDLNRLSDVRQRYPELTEEALRFAYQHAVTQRILTEKIFRIKAQTGQPPFVVSDAGHEVHGTAAALALKHSVNRDAFAISPHYRSGTLVGMWSRLHGSGNFFAQYLRQQLSKITDPWSKGRETASHFRDQRYQILPGQSEVGRNLQKGAGYARALQQKGHKDGLVYAEMGDGSMALSDFHEVMVIANKMGFDGGKLPLVLAVVDNQMAISVEPSSGRALEDLQSYAKAHGIHFATCDGNDFLSVYETYREAVKLSREQQRPTLIWVQNLPRLNNHSSAAAFEFDFNQKDPLTDFGLGLVQQGILTESKILRRNDMLGSGGFFGNHQLGEIGEQSRKRMDALWERVAGEPDPTLEQTLEDVRLEFPKVAEAPRENRPTHTIINGAIRAALRDIIQENPMTWLNGQDTAMKGGVMQATAGLWELFPRNVTDAPINEPAIMSSALGFALHEGAVAFPEIQFGDYALSGYHWMLYAGNLLWRTGGMRKINWNLRLPVEPGIYGAVYHSTPLEGLLASIPGLTIVSFSTARDAYGLIRSAAEYAGPVVIFEPKALYRSALGDAFPGEPALNPKEAAEFEKWVSNYRGIPDIPKDFRVPLGKAAVRREGRDLTIVTWGLAHAETLKVMDTMVQRGIDVEVIDLRTLVPPDMETIKASVEKTGRLLVAHQDRVFASLGREIQGQVQEAFAGKYVPIRILGMQPVPGIPQSKPMEDAVRVKGSDILKAAEEMMGK
jgi:2-oxoisovalerate dehydrogenase E1 component